MKEQCFWMLHAPWSLYQLSSCFSPPPPTVVLKPGSLGAPDYRSAVRPVSAERGQRGSTQLAGSPSGKR